MRGSWSFSVAAFLTAACVLSACTSTSGRATIVPRSETAGARLPEASAEPARCFTPRPGEPPAPVVHEETEDAAFAGLIRDVGETESAGRTRYIFHTHGMGLTDRCAFSNALLELLDAQGYRVEAASDWLPASLRSKRHIRGEALDCRGEWADRPPCAYTTFGQYRIDRLRGPGGDRVIVFSYYWHLDLWRLQYPFLHDDLGQNPGLLASVLKHGTLDEGLNDASTYIGPAGALLREGMDTAICAMLRDGVGSTDPAPAGLATCITDDEANALSPSTSFGFMSHSLGSRMLFDVLSGGWVVPAPGLTEEERVRSEPPAGLVALAQRTSTFFMAANQLPLLASARITITESDPAVDTAPSSQEQTVTPAQGCSTLPVFLALRCAFPPRGLEGIGPLDVVGFVDPGDLLGYRVDGGMRPEQHNGVRFITVEHRNAPQILFLGTWPLAAHDQELQRDTASALILCGGVEIRGRLIPRTCGAGR